MSKYLDKTFIRFILVGMINTLVGTSVMFISYNVFNLSYWISSALNYIIGSIVSYILNKYYTFKVKERSVKYIIKFIINITVCYSIAYGLAKPLVSYLLSNFNTSIKDNISMSVGMCLFVILNYIGQRLFAFRGERFNENY